MIRHTKYIIVFALLFIFFGCKENNALSINTPELDNRSEGKETIEVLWKFSTVYPIGKHANNNLQAIQATYKNLTFKIKNNKIHLDDIGSEELYINKLTTNKYFKQEYLKVYYEKIFSENLNSSLPDSLLVIRNKNSHKQASILKPYFDDAFIADNHLVIQKNGFAILFDNAFSEENNRTSTNDLNLEFPKDFAGLFNKKLVGLAIVNDKSDDIYKKYGLDFSTVCYCDSPSLYIDEKLMEITVFNYCENGKIPTNLEHSYTYKIIKKESDTSSKIILTTNPFLKFIITKNENTPLYSLDVEGEFPKEYIGNDLKKLFTAEPQKFETYICEDFGG